MYYVEHGNKIIFFDKCKENLETTLKFTPQYKNLRIKETSRPIVDFEFADTDEFNEKKQVQENKLKRQKLLNQLDELDIKRIRAICENEIKDEESGQTWLEYYNQKALKLRQELSLCD